eukprot:TRINITY_DN75672_c0_g1_i1.p1 TRINITY_DN75672_c0_g1~~TRINITY_DN75672_c0_g1_i1.p1  ORF type:complete len:369 (+),score=41.57 TRINITY_DN75672_c0_g1_i1:72-1178(+)
MALMKWMANIDSGETKKTGGFLKWTLLGASAVAVGGAIVYWRRKARPNARVNELLLYPVKSGKEVSLPQAIVTAQGFRGDRAFQINDTSGSICTPRDSSYALIFHLRSSLKDGILTLSMPKSEHSPASHFDVDLSKPTKPVRAKCEGLSAAPRPDEDRESLQDYGDEVSAWLSEQLGVPGCRLTGIGNGLDYRRVIIENPKQGDQLESTCLPLSLADEAPFQLASVASLGDLNKRLLERRQAKVTMDRFRPNIVIDGYNLAPWEEDTWKRIRIGEVEFRVWQRCARCEMVTIDRKSLKREKEPLATLATFRKRKGGGINFGMHLIPVIDSSSQGVKINAGQEIVVLEYDEQRRVEWAQLFRDARKSAF